jgi:ribosomal protein S18 acetylase RimI-like enzyme
MSESGPNITIRKMAPADLKAVVEIHIEQFPDSRSTSLGRPYLRKMYRWFLDKQAMLCLVALDNDQVVGFAAGAIGGYGRKIFRYALPEIALGLLMHPALLLRPQTFLLWRSYLQGILPARPAQNPNPANPAQPMILRASLSSIAVARAAQGRGVGKALMAALEASARSLGATLLTLSVRSDNLAARRLYESCLWNVVNVTSDQDSVVYMKQLTG